MNKLISKEIFIENNIKTPKFFLIKKNEYEAKTIQKIINNKKINFPVVLKPINEGSSLGVEICKNKEKLFRSSRYLLKII